MATTYPTEQEMKVVQAAEALMRVTMARYDPSHDTNHVERVRKTALHLARSLPPTAAKPDLLVVELAALLHDILDKKYVAAKAYLDPYIYFSPIFTEWDKFSGLNLIQDGRAKQIVRIVENVSWSTEKKLRERNEWGEWHETCVELHCVQDADRLDAIGALGIMRCAAYSAVTNHPLHTATHDPSSAIAHFHHKLLHIKGRLKTEPGRRLGEKQHLMMLDFLRAVDDECDVRS